MSVLKLLTVYFTRSGNTERVVKKINESIGGDIELIHEQVNRKGILGWIKSGRGNSNFEVAKIDAPQYDPSDYDLVVLATPIWAGSISSPMRGYVVLNKEKLEKTAIFLTNDSGRLEKAWAELDELLVNPPLVKGGLQRSQTATEFEPSVKRFIEAISNL